MPEQEPAFGPIAIDVSPGREVAHGVHQVDGAATAAGALAVLEAVQLAVGVGDLDQERSISHGAPGQRERFLWS